MRHCRRVSIGAFYVTGITDSREQPRSGSDAWQNLRCEQGMDVVDGVDVGHGDIAPRRAEALQAGVHEAEDKTGPIG